MYVTKSACRSTVSWGPVMGRIANGGQGGPGLAAWLTMAVVTASMLAGLSARAASITNVASGLWTNEAIWSGGVVPAALDDVVISNGTTVTMNDMVTHAVSNLTVDGTLTHTANNSSPQYKIVLTASGDVMVTTNGAIDVTATVSTSAPTVWRTGRST